MRGRLAPSPTGALHLGNARSFLLAWLSVRRQGGTLVMRLEDLDGPRIKVESARSILSDLEWLGLDWDEGPYVQSERQDLYRAALQRLREAQLVYPCICTRRDIERALSAPHGIADEGQRYPGTCRDRFSSHEEALAASGGRMPAWRFRVPAGEITFADGLHGPCRHDVSLGVGDFVVFREKAAYQLAVVVDDAEMSIDEVLRGDDLLTSTPRQLLLYRALGLSAPSFLHVPLVVGEDGRRLAKRHGDTRIHWFREQGVAPEVILGWIAHSCGWAEEGEQLDARELLDRFDFAHMPREPTVLPAKTWQAWLANGRTD